MPKRRAGQKEGSSSAATPEEGGAKRSCHDGPGLVTSLESIRYQIVGGLRHVEPYDFDFTTHVKQRWVGRTLLEVFSKEFVAYSAEYYQASIEAGRVTVNGQKVSPGHELRDGERIVHRAVRCRENPVLDRGLIRVVAETKELLVVSKPSSLPIHPCGSYRYNSLIALLRAQGTVAPGAELFTTHRLDRLTSGLVIFAKTKAAARQVGAWFQGSEIRKTYLARVRGSFRELIDSVSGLGGGEGQHTDGAALPAGVTLASEGRIRLNGFIQCIDHKVGKYVYAFERPTVGEEAKDAETQFEFAGAAPNGESVVRCFPSTGRTHQIRVHLNHLGYPIANDSCYGGELRGDPSLPLIPHVRQAHNGVDGEVLEEEAAETTMHPSGIFLHALTYRLPDDEFTSETPLWAEESESGG